MWDLPDPCGLLGSLEMFADSVGGVSWLLEPQSAAPMVEVPEGTDAKRRTLGTQSFIFPCPRW